MVATNTSQLESTLQPTTRYGTDMTMTKWNIATLILLGVLCLGLLKITYASEEEQQQQAVSDSHSIDFNARNGGGHEWRGFSHC
jgi:hypothetical protein